MSFIPHTIPKVPYVVNDLSILNVDFSSDEMYKKIVKFVKENLIEYLPLERWRISYDLSEEFISYLHIYAQFLSSDETRLALHFQVNHLYEKFPSIFITKEKRIENKLKESKIPEIKLPLSYFEEIKDKDLTKLPGDCKIFIKSVSHRISKKRWKVSKLDFDDRLIEISSLIKIREGNILNLSFTSRSTFNEKDKICYLSFQNLGKEDEEIST